MKPTTFIGSSKEGIDIVTQIQSLLSHVTDTLPWISDDAFAPNRSTLDSLLKNTSLSDFSVLIATKDDILKMPARGIKKEVARDNVIFEYGLFLGATGVDKAFLLVEEGTDLPSDLIGITLLTFVRAPGLYNSIEKRCKYIEQLIIKESSQSQLGFVPSTALAIGYYNSFVKKLCEKVKKDGRVKFNNKKLEIRSFKLYVVLPNDIDDDGVDSFRVNYHMKNNLEAAATLEVNNERGYPFHFKIDPPGQSVKSAIDVHFYDVPTTINTILEAIKIHYHNPKVGFSKEMEYLEKRELLNFSKALKFLISKNSWTKDNVVVLENVVL